MLENITYLKINGCYHESWERLLGHTPCLETIVFVLDELLDSPEKFMNPPKEVPPCLVSRIKAIKLLSFRWTESEVRMVKYFLKHAQVLENLMIRCTVFETRCSFNVSIPTLKRLTPSGFNRNEIVIDAPNLAFFKCFYLPKRFLLKNLNSLV
ncbi:hypothetical protein QUC31_001863 [Theobroma cacao]